MSTVVAPTGRGARAPLRPLAWVRRRALRLGVLVYLGLLVGLPVGYLFIKAFSPGLSAFWSSVTTPDSVAALELSAKVVAVVVPINTVVGVGAAILIARHRFVGRRFLDLTFDVPIAVSPIIIGVALILAYAERTGWFGPWLLREGIMVIYTPLGVTLASLAVSLPYVLRSVVPVLVEVGETQEAAARTLGAGAWRRFFTITLPSIRWGVLYGVVLTLARTLGEFGAVLLVSGAIEGKTQTLPVYIFSVLDQDQDLAASYAGAVVLASISIVALVVLSILRSREQKLHVDIA